MSYKFAVSDLAIGQAIFLAHNDVGILTATSIIRIE